MYLGIIVQNNDPKKRGRCKIFIPHISTYIYDNWTQDKTDKIFNFIDQESNADVQRILADLKTVLPWGEFAGQIFGGNSSGRYNATKKTGYVNDHNEWKDGDPAFTNRPAATYNNASPAKDAFWEAGNVNVTNPYSHAYSASDSSTLASGVFSIPNVGAHVWCFFEGGDVNCPVYFASSYGTEDIKRIYTTNKYTSEAVASVEGEEVAKQADGAPDYPATYENIDDGDLSSDAKTFRSKHVINSNKHLIEMVDTDKRESLKLTHYSGSFKEFTNLSNIELATKNDQKLVIGDSFETVRRSKNVYIDGDFNRYYDGDIIERVGDYDIQTVTEIKDVITDLHSYMQLFDIRRVKAYDRSDNLPNFISNKQTRQKATKPDAPCSADGFALCPICKSKPYVFNLPGYLVGLQSTPILTSIYSLLGPALQCTTAVLFLTEAGKYPTLKIPLPIPTPFDTQLGAQLSKVSGVGYFAAAKCDLCNSDLLPAGFPEKNPGFSPSSFNGEFEPEKLTEPGGEFDQALVAAAPKLIDLQRRLSGGDKIININKNKVETIGSVMNDLPSLRVDPIGKLRAENVYVAPESVYQSYRPAPHVEPVVPLDVPGGDYILTATNKYKLLVGAKGINIKTFGPIDMYGTLVNITGQQLNISSQYETNIDGGDRFSLRARKIALMPKEHSPVLVDGALHVSRNAIVQGGMYVEGQFGTPAIASLREYGETSDAIWEPPSGATLDPEQAAELGEGEAELPTLSHSFVACGQGVIDPNTGIVTVAVLIPKHTHLYERPPSQLFNSIQALRTFFADPGGKPTRSSGNSASINSTKRSTAAAPVNDLATGEAAIPAKSFADEVNNRLRTALTNAPWVNEAAVSGGVSVSSSAFNSIKTLSSGVFDIKVYTEKGQWAYSVRYQVEVDPSTGSYIPGTGTLTSALVMTSGKPARALSI